MDEDVLFKYLTEPVLSFNLPTAKLNLLLNACKDQQILTCKPEKEPEISKVFEGINKKISVSTTRHAGILLLKTFLPQCYDEIFAQNAVVWMKNCIAMLKSTNTSINGVTDSYELLASLFELSGRLKSVKRSMSSEIVPMFFNAVVEGREKSSSLHKSILVLRCIKPLMKHFATACQRYRSNYVWKFLWEAVSCDNSTLAIIAGECMCYFTRDPMSKDSQQWNDEKRALQKEMTLQIIFSRLCATASELLFQLFQNVNELRVSGSINKLPKGYKLMEDETMGEDKKPREDDLVRVYGMWANCFVNVLSLMQGILSNDTEFPKRLDIPQVLAVVFRVLRVNVLSIRGSMGTVEHIALLSVLPAVHAAVFNFLRFFVTCYDGLHGYGILFCQFVLESLQWTNAPCVAGNVRRYGCVREAANLFLEAWVIRARAASSIELFAEELVVLLLDDIVQKKKKVTLQVKTGKVGQYLTKRALLNPEANAETCVAALRAIRAIIEASGSLLKTHHHLMLQETVVSLLLEMRRKNLESMPYPFYSPECRLQLYRVLLALTVHPHGSWPAPLQFALTLFPHGQNDPSLEVSSFCLLASATTRQMVHPSRSNAQFPISLEDMRVSAGLKENPLNFSIQGKLLRGKRVNGASKFNAVEGTPVNGISPKVAKRKLKTQTFVTSPDGTKENTPEINTVKKTKNSSPALKKKKLAPVVNGLDNGFESNKKSKMSWETDSFSLSSSSERLLKKKRSLSESSVGSFDLSGSKNMLRLSTDSWTVVDLPQQESSNKKRKKVKQKQQVNEKSVDVEPQSKKGQRVQALETMRVKTPFSADISWNVSETPSPKISPKKSFTRIPFTETESPVQEERQRSLGEGKTLVKVVPIPLELARAKQSFGDGKQEKSMEKGKGGANSIGNKNAELRKERVEGEENEEEKMVKKTEKEKEMLKKTEKEKMMLRKTETEKEMVKKTKKEEEMVKKTEKEEEMGKKTEKEEEMGKKTEKEKQMTDVAVAQGEKGIPTNQRPLEDSSMSQSCTLEDLPVEHSSISQEKQPPTPVKDSNSISEGVIRSSNQKLYDDKTITSKSEVAGVVDFPGDKETKSHSREMPQEDKPQTPVKKSKVASDECVKMSDTMTIEEIPSEEVGSAYEETSSISAVRNAPIVDLADSDNSCSVISLDSNGKEERLKTVSSEVKESAVNTSFEECQDPDASTGMDAVVESPRISLEGTKQETSVSAAEEKPSSTRGDSKKDSDSDEDILTTFVDIVSTNSG